TYKTEAGKVDLRKSLAILRETAVSINPLLLVFLVPGLMLLPGLQRRLFTVVFLVLFLLGTVAVPLKPQLELDRMLLLLALLSALPCSLSISKLFSSIPLTGGRWRHSLLPASVGAFLFATVFSAASVMLNRSSEMFFFSGSLTENLAKAIAEHGGVGRTVFSGFVMHDLNKGHISHLPYYTGTPMVASSHVHNLWRYKQVFPKSFIDRGDTGMDEYLDLFNATSVVAHEKPWIEYFLKRPQDFHHVWAQHRFHLFKRRAPVSGYFLEGKGKIIEQSTSGITLVPQTESLVLSFRYVPSLISSDCTIGKANIDQEVIFIKLDNCPVGKEVRLRSASYFSRLLRGV
ncbi:hypothetical protein BVY02_01445, partial [bacterium J17]